MKLTIGHLYPDLLNLYGDRGNIQCMMKRSIWRGIEAETIAFSMGDSIDFSKLDIVLLGGGSDREQRIVCSKLSSIRDDFRSYVEDGGSVIAVCGGYQLLGHYYKTEEGTLEGLSLVDLYTEQGSPRLIDNIVLENPDFSLPIVGFENHGGRTYIGNNKPFGKVLYGHGNIGEDVTEGVLNKNVVGTISTDLCFRKIRTSAITFSPMPWRENMETVLFLLWMIPRKKKRISLSMTALYNTHNMIRGCLISQPLFLLNFEGIF